MTGAIKPLFTVASAAWLLFANTSLESPRIGYLRLANQEVWSLRGLAGAFYLSERTAAAVDFHSFNGAIGIRTSGDHAEFLGPSGEVLRIVRLEGEVLRVGLSTIEDTAYVLTGAELWRINAISADRFPPPDLPEDQRIAGIGGAGSYLDLATVTAGQVTERRLWLETGESTILRDFGGEASHVVFLPYGMVLWSEASVLHLRRADGSTVEIAAGAPVASLAPLSKNVLHAATAEGRQYALRIEGDPVIPQSIEARLLPLPESSTP